MTGAGKEPGTNLPTNDSGIPKQSPPIRRRFLGFIRRHVAVLTLLGTLLGVVVAVLAWLIPRDPTDRYGHSLLGPFERDVQEEPLLTEGIEDEAVRTAIEEANRHEDDGLTEEASDLWRGIATALEGTDRERAAEVWLRSGQLLAADERTRPNALTDFDNAIRLCEDCPRFWYFRGLAKGMLRDHKGAVEDFGQVIKHDPGMWKGYAMRGNAWTALGDFPRAVDDYDAAIRLEDRDGRIWLDRGVALGKQGRHCEALNSFDRAVGLLKIGVGMSWPLVSAYRNRAVAYDALGQEEMANEDRAAARDVEDLLGGSQ